MSTEWVNILKATGYPTDVVVLDFETYFDQDYTLRKISTIEYIQDQRFEELGLARLEMSGKRPHPTPCAYFETASGCGLPLLQKRYGKHLEKCTVVAHNARFDVGVLTYRHNIRPPFVIDTLGLARHVAARKRNDLGRLCDRYDLIGKGDTDQFKGVRYADMTTAMRSNLAAYAENDAMREWEIFQILLPVLTRPDVELKVMQHTLQMFTRPLLTFDFHRADEIKAEMVATEAEIVTLAGFTRKEVSGTNSFERILREVLDPDQRLPKLKAEYLALTRGDLASPNKYSTWKDNDPDLPADEKFRRTRRAFLQTEIARLEPPMKQGKLKPLVAVAKTDPGYGYLLHHEKPEVRRLMEAKVAIKTWPKNVKRVSRMVAHAKACGGFLPVPLKYHGAHTGRWSGDEKINLQNLTARSPHDCINAIRNLLTAPPGDVLVITDAAQIEARNLAWQARQDDLIEAFVEGRQIYCEFASEVMGKYIRKPLACDPPPVVKYLKHYRMFGKVGILGCGYGMGVDRCLAYAHDVYHLDIDRPMATRIVGHYREKYKKICQLWTDVEQAFKYVVRYPSETCTLEPGLQFSNTDETVSVTLPSGRALYYHSPYITKDERGRDQLCMPDERIRGAEIRMWGGYLVENLIQAESRDVLGDAILALEDIGYPVALTAHDEVILVVPEDQGEDALATSIQILSQTPTWMTGCPLGAEGQITERYCK